MKRGQFEVPVKQTRTRVYGNPFQDLTNHAETRSILQYIDEHSQVGDDSSRREPVC